MEKSASRMRLVPDDTHPAVRLAWSRHGRSDQSSDSMFQGRAPARCASCHRGGRLGGIVRFEWDPDGKHCRPSGRRFCTMPFHDPQRDRRGSGAHRCTGSYSLGWNWPWALARHHQGSDPIHRPLLRIAMPSWGEPVPPRNWPTWPPRRRFAAEADLSAGRRRLAFAPVMPHQSVAASLARPACAAGWVGTAVQGHWANTGRLAPERSCVKNAGFSQRPDHLGHRG